MQRITTTPVESSRIAAIGHDGKSTMQVDFKRKDGVSSYHYSNVSPEMFDEFMKAESKGKHFLATFKNEVEKFPFTRLVEEKEVAA